MFIDIMTIYKKRFILKKTIFLSALLLLFCEVVFCQEEVRQLTIDDAVILAADNNLSLKRNQLALNQLELKDKYSWNSVSPSIGASAQFGNGLQENSTSLSISGNVSFRLTPSLYSSIKSAKLNYENGITSYETAVKTVEKNVRQIFYSLIYSKENLSLLNRNLETAKQRYDLSQEKFSRGQLSELDLLTTQMNYESLKPSYESAEIAYENSIANFKQLLGINQNEQIDLIGNLDEMMNVSINQDLLEYNIEELPTVKEIKSKIELAKTNLLATKFSAWGPSLSLGYNASKAGQDMTGEFAWADFKQSVSVGVSIPLDGYLPWSNGSLSVSAQKSNLEDLNLQLENEKTTVELTIKKYIKEINQAKSQLSSLQNNVALAQKTYDMTLNAYNYGSRDLLTLQNAADSLLKSKNQLQSQVYNLICKIMDLEFTLGLPLGALTAAE
ncbi:MAG: TolC family protein [Treponema bryantii]|nr:TolC family protein [Treponema bryantii]